ncbi:MAG: sensor domain-containing diguanylate cyclase [Acidimicrobiales bacterium]|nr:sensor domain-containing diguanylate cyclase [Acidimicrobiales bacterium]
MTPPDCDGAADGPGRPDPQHLEELLERAVARTGGVVGGGPAAPLAEAMLALADDESWMLVDLAGAQRYTLGPPGGLLGWADKPSGVLERLHPDDLAEVSAALPAALAQPEVVHRVRARVRDAAGEFRWVELTMWSRLDDPAIAGLVVRTRLVAPPDDAELLLGSSLVDLLPTPVLAAAPNGRVAAANPAAVELLGRDAAALAGTGWLDAFEPAARPALIDAARVAQWQGEPTRVDARCGDLDLSVAFAAQGPAPPHGWIATVEDHTQHTQVARELAVAAGVDPLTGLLNRRSSIDALGRLLADDRPTAVLFCDLDGFKAVNDTLGHHAGDVALTQVAVRLSAAVRAADQVGRWGGDEFVVLCPDTPEAQAEAVAERLRVAMAEPLQLGDHRFTVGVSVGAAAAQGAGIDPATLLDRADRAMYEHKQRPAPRG